MTIKRIQVPGRSLLKGQRHVTREDELSFRRSDLNTILSTRDHRQDADHVIVVQAKEEAPYSLDQLQQALMRPVFVLYLGRKSCPPSAPLKPSVMNASTLLEVFGGLSARDRS
ncbi:MAG: type I-E CRISPR-associated protein Cas5/CasD [Aquabacterium sp.]